MGRRSSKLLAAVGATALLSVVPAGATDSSGWGAAPPEAPGSGIRRITGGSQTLITAVPWQVRIRGGGLCGGAILDATHVVTAAHCTYSSLDSLDPLLPGELEVVSGSSSFTTGDGTPPNGPQPPDDPVVSSVVEVRRHPAYIPSADGTTTARLGIGDVAVLTLGAPLTLNGVVRQAISLPTRNNDLPVGSPLSVSGFGLQDEFYETLDGKLYRLADMQAVDPVTWTGDWNALYTTATSPSGLACSGDSGGPLVQGSGSGAVLVGLVAFGPSCDPNDTSVYTNVAAGEIRDFITGNDSPPTAPIGGGEVRMTTDPGGLPLTPGRSLTCNPGTWSGSPQFTARFSDGDGATLQDGSAATYVIQATDIGRRIRCQATARNDGGVGRTPRTVLTPAIAAQQQTTTSPPLTPAPRTPPTNSTTAKISPALIADPSRVRRGRTVRLTIRVGNAAAVVLARPRVCVSLPTGWTVTKRGNTKRSGRRWCASRNSLAANGSLTTTITVRAGVRAKRGLHRFKATASADNAAAASATRTIRVR